MKRTAFFLVTLMILALTVSPLWASSEAPSVTPDEAMSMLKEGNARYIAGTATHPSQDQERRTLTSSKGQHPFATVLACSDSRVPVEILFDRGIGDIFIIRVAGNVADVDEAGSIEYGVDHLGTPVLVILGHTHCGAVTAVAKNAELHGNIPALVDNIKPAVDRVKAKHPELSGDAFVAEAVKANIWQAMEDLFKASHATRGRVEAGKLKVIGAVYDIDSGKVEWMGSHPEEAQLMKKYAEKAKRE